MFCNFVGSVFSERVEWCLNSVDAFNHLLELN